MACQSSSRSNVHSILRKYLSYIKATRRGHFNMYLLGELHVARWVQEQYSSYWNALQLYHSCTHLTMYSIRLKECVKQFGKVNVVHNSSLAWFKLTFYHIFRIIKDIYPILLMANKNHFLTKIPLLSNIIEPDQLSVWCDCPVYSGVTVRFIDQALCCLLHG